MEFVQTVRKTAGHLRERRLSGREMALAPYERMVIIRKYEERIYYLLSRAACRGASTSRTARRPASSGCSSTSPPPTGC